MDDKDIVEKMYAVLNPTAIISWCDFSQDVGEKLTLEDFLKNVLYEHELKHHGFTEVVSFWDEEDTENLPELLRKEREDAYQQFNIDIVKEFINLVEERRKAEKE